MVVAEEGLTVLGGGFDVSFDFALCGGMLGCITRGFREEDIHVDLAFSIVGWKSSKNCLLLSINSYNSLDHFT